MLIKPHRMMFGIAALAVAATLGACGADNQENGGDSDGAVGSDAPDWSISYSGARSGEVSGTVTTMVEMTISTNEVSLAARSHDSDAGLSASYSYPSDDDPLGEKRMRSFSLTLEDGTSCSQDVREGRVITARVTDHGEDAYHANLSGSLDCDGEEITVDGYFRE